MPTNTTLAEARQTAEKAWYLFTRERNLQARVPDWRTSTAPDGRPLLSAEVVGPGAAHALARFAADAHFVVGPDGQRPQYDIDVPGRTVVVWRTGGVWVQLWHPDTVTNLPATPAPAVAPPVARQGLLSRASGRLPYARRSKTTNNAPAA